MAYLGLLYIWVVHDICGPIAGYAYYPTGNEYDGTVIDILSMNYESGVLSHEIGHGLNLKHTFSGDDEACCPVNEDCLEDGDEICDTLLTALMIVELIIHAPPKAYGSTANTIG
jgi:hypothetical protein